MADPIKTIQIFQREQPKTFAAGETIFRQGEQAHYLYGIVSGEVEMRVADQPIEVLQAGAMFGEGALVHADRTRSSTAIAKTDCTLAMLDEKRFLFVVQETPNFALDVMRSYSDRMRQMRLMLI